MRSYHNSPFHYPLDYIAGASMRKVIDGKTYNTTTAEEIGRKESRRPLSAYDCDEILYQTKKGRFFIWGAGKPFSQYGEPSAGASTSGSDIRALTAEEALEWCEEHEVDTSLLALDTNAA